MRANILLVFSPYRGAGLLGLLKNCDVQTSLASTIQEAQRKLSSSVSYDMVVTDEKLPDGSWQELLDFSLESKRTCEFIVSYRSADEDLWAEVLQRGAYDVLVEPYNRQEVHRIIVNALESHYMERVVSWATSPKQSLPYLQ